MDTPPHEKGWHRELYTKACDIERTFDIPHLDAETRDPGP